MLFTGRLTANAEITAVKDKQVINFTVALNQKWKNKAGEKQEKTAFIDCAYWRSSGIAEYLTKGAVVEISGWTTAQAYQTQKGELRAKQVCTCDTIKLFSLMTKPQEQAQTKPVKQTSKSSGAEDDDLPF